MHVNVKLPLMIAMVLWAFFPTVDAHAQLDSTNASTPSAVPVASVDAEPLATGQELIVLELFSSQACVFCPKADELFSALLTVPNVIGLACHVDYFDVRNGSLSRPFCTARQSWYMQALGAGPNYTPQMIINGTMDVVGYKLEDIKTSIKLAQQHPPLLIEITKAATADDYTLSWSAPATTTDGEAALLWLMLIDKPHDLEIAEGRNAGKRMNYVNIVSDMEDRGEWKAADLNKTIKTTLNETQQGFIVIAQGRQSGKILAAGQFSLLPPLPPGEGRGEGKLP